MTKEDQQPEGWIDKLLGAVAPPHQASLLHCFRALSSSDDTRLPLHSLPYLQILRQYEYLLETFSTAAACRPVPPLPARSPATMAGWMAAAAHQQGRAGHRPLTKRLACSAVM